MAIIGALPVTLTNGTTADATQVMSDFNSIISQVNANAAALTGGNVFSGTQTINGDPVVTLTAIQNVTGKTLNSLAGSVGLPSYSFVASFTSGMWSPASNAVGIATNGVNVMYFDPNQNIGFGVTPSAWATLRAIEGPSGGLAFNGTVAIYLTQNIEFLAGGWTYKTTAAGSLYVQSGGTHIWSFVPSGTAGNAVTPTNAMTLDGTGNLLLGSSSSGLATAGRGLIEVAGASGAMVALKIAGIQSGYTFHDGTNMHVTNLVSGGLIIETNGVARVNTDSTGRTAFAGSAATTPSAGGNISGAVTLDCSKSNVIETTLNGNVTGLTLSNIISGQTVNIFMTQDGVGSRTLGGLTSGNNYVWPGGTPGVLSTAAASVDLVTITFRSSTGKFYCTLAKGFA